MRTKYTHTCATCTENDGIIEGVILTDENVSDAGGYVFCDTCGSVLVPMDKTETFQIFAAEVDSLLRKWTGKGLSDFQIELDKPECTAKETALNLLDKMRKDSTLGRFATQTVIYLDGETTWKFAGGQTLNYSPPATWNFTMTYKLK